jgi:hypothetical protein
VDATFSLRGRELKFEHHVHIKNLVRLVFHTAWHNYFGHYTIGGSNPVAGSGGRFTMQLGPSWSRLHRSVASATD